MTFVRGNGFVLEQGYVESASKAQSESAFNRAFAGSAYINDAAQGVYMNDNMTFIEQPKGRTNYIATIKYNGNITNESNLNDPLFTDESISLASK